MSLEAIIYAKLSGTPAIVTAANGGIYPLRAKKDAAFDYIVYQLVDNIPVTSAGVTSNTKTARIQVDFYSDDYDRAVAGRKLISNTLDRWPQSESVTPIDGVILSDCILDAERMLYEDVLSARRASIDFMCLTY